MKKLVMKLLAIFSYLSILLYLSGFDLFVLINLKLLILTLIGTVILSIPHYHKDCSKDDVMNIIAKNAIATGYIETFLYLFVRLNSIEGFHNLLPDIALNCRPALYGFIIFVLFSGDEKKQIPGDEKEASEAVVTTISLEDQYQKLKDMGLTTREVEISQLIISGYSNHEIAEELYISETTVKKHVSNIFSKLQITKREQLITILQKKDQGLN